MPQCRHCKELFTDDSLTDTGLCWSCDDYDRRFYKDTIDHIDHLDALDAEKETKERKTPTQCGLCRKKFWLRLPYWFRSTIKNKVSGKTVVCQRCLWKWRLNRPKKICTP